MINLELSDICNETCRHCYNYWRDENASTTSLDEAKFDRLLALFVEQGIFHVVLTGGEPMVKFDLLEYALRRLHEANITTSVNSNLTLLRPDRAKRLVDAGLDHILTSLCSADEATNDHMTNTPGSYRRIVKGIGVAVDAGIRVSVNMIVSKANLDQVYDTAVFAHELGCQKLFGTRTVPSVNLTDVDPADTEFGLDQAAAMHILDQLIAAKRDTGIMIGTLVSYPLCMLSDLERYRDFVGRGCPGQSGHLVSINANGDTHACAHEEKQYGNVFRDGLLSSYQNMSDWHGGKYHYDGCKECDYLPICQSGCRMSAQAYHRKIDGQDQLFQGKENFVKPYKVVYDEEIFDYIDGGGHFTPRPGLRFRREPDFYMLNIQWANTVVVPTHVGELIERCSSDGGELRLEDLSGDVDENRMVLAKLFHKDALRSPHGAYDELKQKAGLGVDILLGTAY